MKILAYDNYSREGNDCWLDDTIEIVEDDLDIILRHTEKYSGGWTGKGREVFEMIIKGDTISEMRDKVCRYLEDEGLRKHIDLGDNYGIS
jgi:hypothetical protein